MGLWVARMVMASEYCMKQIPFEHVLIHPTVMGADGKPMSKSRGNGVDPIDLINEYGADALRFGLLTQVTGGQAIRFDKQKIENARNFANKIRNAARFVMMNMEGVSPHEIVPNTEKDVDQWIMARLAVLVERVETAYKTYDFGEVTKALYTFFWNEFCDWYIEFSKSRLNGTDEEDKRVCQDNLLFVLEMSLRLLHPIMPFVTEEIYQQLPMEHETKHLIMAAWPDASAFASFRDEASEVSIGLVCDIVGSARSIRARYGISPKQELEVVVKPKDNKLADLISSQVDLIKRLANTSELSVDEKAAKPNQSSVVVANGVEIYIVLEGLVDFDAERKRLTKELDALKKDEAMFSKKLSNPGFLQNAKPEVVEKDKGKLAKIQENISLLEAQIKEIE